MPLPDLDDIHYNFKMLNIYVWLLDPNYKEEFSDEEMQVICKYYEEHIYLFCPYDSDSSDNNKQKIGSVYVMLKNKAIERDNEKAYVSLEKAYELAPEGVEFKRLLWRIATKDKNLASHCLIQAIKKDKDQLINKLLLNDFFATRVLGSQDLDQLEKLFRLAMNSNAKETFICLHNFFVAQNSSSAENLRELRTQLLCWSAKEGSKEFFDCVLDFASENYNIDSTFVQCCFEGKNKDIIKHMLKNGTFIKHLMDLCKSDTFSRIKFFICFTKIDFCDELRGKLYDALLTLCSSKQDAFSFIHRAAIIGNVSALKWAYSIDEIREKLRTIDVEQPHFRTSVKILEGAIRCAQPTTSKFMLEIMDAEAIRENALVFFKTCFQSCCYYGSLAEMKTLRIVLQNKQIQERIAATTEEEFPLLDFFCDLKAHKTLTVKVIDPDKLHLLLAMIDDNHEYYKDVLNFLYPSIMQLLFQNMDFSRLDKHKYNIELLINAMQNADFVAAWTRLDDSLIFDYLRTVTQMSGDQEGTFVKFITNFIDVANQKPDDAELKTKLALIITLLSDPSKSIRLTCRGSDAYFRDKPEIFKVLADNVGAESGIIEIMLDNIEQNTLSIDNIEQNTLSNTRTHANSHIRDDEKLSSSIFLKLQFITEFTKQYDLHPFSSENVKLLEYIVFQAIHLTSIYFETEGMSNWNDIGVGLDEFSKDSTNDETGRKIAEKLAYLNKWLHEKQEQAGIIHDKRSELLMHPQQRLRSDTKSARGCRKF